MITCDQNGRLVARPKRSDVKRCTFSISPHSSWQVSSVLELDLSAMSYMEDRSIREKTFIRKGA